MPIDEALANLSNEPVPTKPQTTSTFYHVLTFEKKPPDRFAHYFTTLTKDKSPANKQGPLETLCNNLGGCEIATRVVEHSDISGVYWFHTNYFIRTTFVKNTTHPIEGIRSTLLFADGHEDPALIHEFTTFYGTPPKRETVAPDDEHLLTLL